jgi:uncharacterized integral membrane protein
MRRVVTWIVAVSVGLVALAFAVQNRASVTIGLWPLPERWEMPLFLAVLGAVVIGFLAGGFVSWLSAGRWRRMARRYVAESERLQRRVEGLEGELTRAREEARRDQPTLPSPRPEAPGRPPAQLADAGRR